MGIFNGVVSWAWQLPSNWLDDAIDVLSPIACIDGNVGIADKGPPGHERKLMVLLAGEVLSIEPTEALISRGLVPKSGAGWKVVCLIALRKHLGGLELVNEAQEGVSACIRQSNPLYADDWQRVKRLAEALGLLREHSMSQQACGAVLATLF